MEKETMKTQTKNYNGLSEDQYQIYSQLIEGKNLFVTGGAGTGKSHLIRYFLAEKPTEVFPVLASTGAAAVLVEGRTFHSFFGLGILEGGARLTVEKALRNPRLVRRMQKVAGIVIDEVSMLGGEVVAAAEEIARRARSSEQPWGGMQVVAVGDFFQLPPVSREPASRIWAFQHPVWEMSQLTKAHLKENLRAAGDPDLVRILNFIREGVVNNDVRDYLNAHVRPPIDDKSMRLYPRRNQAEAYNLERLSQVSGQEFTVATTYTGAKHFIETLKRTAPIAEEISFKIGAVVMLRQNDPLMRWVNGSIGTIQDFESDKLTIELKSGSVVQVEAADFSMVDADGDIVAVATNFPINLAYAATIHKAQGATLDTMVVDLKSLWEPGHTYVALSRVRRGDDLFISRWDEQSIRVDSEVSAFYQ